MATGSLDYRRPVPMRQQLSQMNNTLKQLHLQQCGTGQGSGVSAAAAPRPPPPAAAAGTRGQQSPIGSGTGPGIRFAPLQPHQEPAASPYNLGHNSRSGAQQQQHQHVPIRTQQSVPAAASPESGTFRNGAPPTADAAGGTPPSSDARQQQQGQGMSPAHQGQSTAVYYTPGGHRHTHNEEGHGYTPQASAHG